MAKTKGRAMAAQDGLESERLQMSPGGGGVTTIRGAAAHASESMHGSGNGAADLAPIEPPSRSYLAPIASELDLEQDISLMTMSDLDKFFALVEFPPRRSVIVKIGPKVADWLLKNRNDMNRPQQKKHARALGSHMDAGNYEMTGDTLKVSKGGNILDGQHRLGGCVTSGDPFTTHIIFGLEDAVFDVLDQGKKRTPGDVLARDGVKSAAIVAGAVRKALIYQNQLKGNDISTDLSPRKIRAMVLGPMKDIQDYALAGQLVRAAYKHPPTMITAILYLISRHNKATAENFVHEWLHGAKLPGSRNENFDVLSTQLISIARRGGGHIALSVRAAMIIQTFNHWNANVVARPRDIEWRAEWTFPKLEFNTEEFLKQREQSARGDTSAMAVMDRLLVVLARKTGNDGLVSISHPELAAASDVPQRQISYLLEQMQEKALIQQIRGAGIKGPAQYRIADGGKTRLKAMTKAAS